jgi:hypothetical protein
LSTPLQEHIKSLRARSGSRRTPDSDGSTIQALAQLTESLSQVSIAPTETASCGDLADLLQQQEQELLGARITPELAAARNLKRNSARLQSRRVLKQALQESPEDSGPLNPQRLAVDSMKVMGELSPHYLDRFVAYVDTLLWLEQADN